MVRIRARQETPRFCGCNEERGMRTPASQGLIAALLLFAVVLMATGCETAEGFGEDMQSAGEEIEEEAD